MKRDKLVNIHSNIVFGKDTLTSLLTQNEDTDINLLQGEISVITTKDNEGIYTLNVDGSGLIEYKPFSAIKEYVDYAIMNPPSLDYFSIIIDQSIADPATMITEGYNYNGTLMRLFFSKIRRCVIENNASYIDPREGTIGLTNIKFLNDVDSNNYATGGTADVSNKDVMVYFPEFYYIGVQDTINPLKYELKISLKPLNGYTFSPAFLIGAYKACSMSNEATNINGDTTTSMIYSRHGKYRVTNLAKDVFTEKAENRGNGFQIIDYEMRKVLCVLFMFKYKNTNSQDICGAGPNIVSGKTNGSTTNLGMTDTTTINAGTAGNTSTTFILPNFLGVEGAWGYTYEYIDDISATGDGTQETWNINIPSKYTKSGGGIRSLSSQMLPASFISQLKIEKKMDIIPITGNGSSNTYFCDYGLLYPNKTEYRIMFCSATGSTAYGGITYCSTTYNSSHADGYFGTRLAFRGKIHDIDNNIDLN